MSSGFISEAEIAEQRRTRQEEWEKVRKPDQPEEVPEEPYDRRSLFERLEEQKQRKELDYEEAHKLKNMVKGLDDDEVEFLEQVERRKMDAELRTSREEALELQAFRDAVAKAQEDALNHRLQAEIKTRPVQSTPSRSSQGRLLAGIVVRKRSATSPDETPEKKLCTTDISKLSTSNACTTDNHGVPEKGNIADGSGRLGVKTESTSNVASKVTDQVSGSEAMQCIGILPGLGSYPDSSDSEASSDTDTELAPVPNTYDLLGRKVTTTVAKDLKTTASH